MRTIDPFIHDPDVICDMLRASGVDPSMIPLEPFTYDGRRREYVVQEVCRPFAAVGDRPKTVTRRHRVVRGREPRHFLAA